MRSTILANPLLHIPTSCCQCGMLKGHFMFGAVGLAGLVPSAALPNGGWPGQGMLYGPMAGARWVAEGTLPPWLVRGHEEKARREAAVRAAEAARMAERVRMTGCDIVPFTGKGCMRNSRNLVVESRGCNVLRADSDLNWKIHICSRSMTVGCGDPGTIIL